MIYSFTTFSVFLKLAKMGIYYREQPGKCFKAKLKVSEEEMKNIWSPGSFPVLFSLLIYCTKENLNLLTINLQHFLKHLMVVCGLTSFCLFKYCVDDHVK